MAAITRSSLTGWKFRREMLLNEGVGLKITQSGSAPRG